MVAFKNWEPSESDIVWVSNLVNILKEGAVWTLPMNGQQYQFFHSKKEIHLVSGPMDNMFTKNKLAFSQIGYTVFDKRR